MSDTVLEVDFGPPHGKRSFQSHQELMVWWGKERSFWNLFLNAQASHAAGDIRSSITQLLNQCERALQEGAQLWTPEVAEKRPDALKNWIRNAKDLIEGHYLRGRFFLAESPKGQFLTSYLGVKGALAATYAASYFLRPAQLGNTYLRQDAEITSFCFEEGLANRAEAEVGALKQAELRWEESRKAHEQELMDQKNKATEWIEEQRKALKTFNEGTIAHQTAFALLMRKSEEDLAKIKATYDQKLALHAPVLYWRAKSLHHGRAAKKLGTGALIAATLSVAMMIAVALALLVLPIFENPSWKPELGNFFAVVLIGSALMWLMREVVRVWLSHVHLRNDAQFRITLMRTYLSLLRSEKGIGKEEHAALVAALYRPTPDGVVKEDGIPASSLEALARGLGRS